MLVNILFIVGGLFGLFYGADWLVKGAARIASSLGIPPLVIGLTVVSYGTSMPEQVISLIAVFKNNGDIAMGNVVGSSIGNIGLILGLTGLIFPVAVHARLIQREIPVLIGVSILVHLLAVGGRINRLEGLILFSGAVAFTYASYRFSKGHGELAEVEAEIEQYDAERGLTPDKVNQRLEVGRVLVGIILLVIGAQMLVEGATQIATEAGVSDVVIGLTLVALGTSLPELATSLVAALRKESDISVGNIVGSNMFNLLSILGITALVRPISVSEDLLRYDFPFLIGMTVMLFIFVLNEKLTRRESSLLLALYAGYTVFLFMR